MQVAFKILALVLLTAVAASAAMPQMMFAMPAPQAHPAGCHESGGSSAPASPVSYQCCRTGHYSAILQASSNGVTPLAEAGHALAIPITPSISRKVEFAGILLFSGGPPLATSLRI